MRELFAVFAIISLIACSPVLQPLSSSSLIEGERIEGVKLEVKTAFTIEPYFWSATYPAGLYIPKFEDKDGIYFQATDEIFQKRIDGGGTLKGGLYVAKKSWSDFEAYIDTLGIMRKYKIPFEVEFEIER